MSIHHMQFTVIQVTVQHLVMAMTYTLLIMLIRILVPTIILAPHTLFQITLQTVIQSWLEPVTFHLTRLRYFISLESRCLFLSPCTQKPSELKEKLYPKKITLKRIAKQRASKWLNILITLCFIHGFSLLIKLNGTHVRVRWFVTRSEAVCECRFFQSIFWTSKEDVF